VNTSPANARVGKRIDTNATAPNSRRVVPSREVYPRRYRIEAKSDADDDDDDDDDDARKAVVASANRNRVVKPPTKLIICIAFEPRGFFLSCPSVITVGLVDVGCIRLSSTGSPHRVIPTPN